MRTRAVGVALAAVLFASAATSYAAEERDRDANILVVSGSGEVRVVPDRAVVRLGVETRADRAADAIAENNRLMSRVVEAIRAQRVPERAIQTSTLSVSREYEPLPPGSERRPRAIYVVTNIVTARLEDVTRVGGVIDAATGAGANVVHGISFQNEKEDEAQQEALRQAVREARAKADTIAKALDLRIVGVESVSESGAPIVLQEHFDGAVAMRRGQEAPVLPGENTIRASVTVRFRIAR